MNKNPFLKTDDQPLNYLLLSIDRPGIPTETKDMHISLLVFICFTEPFKVILRKNIGKNALKIMRVYIACCIYLVWAFLLLWIGFNPKVLFDEQITILFRNMMFVGAITYVILALYIFARATVANRKAERSNIKYDDRVHYHRGDSLIFGALIQRKWTHQRIWLMEGFLTLVTTISLTIIPMLFNIWLVLLGIPLVLTSISFLINEYIAINDLWELETQKLNLARDKEIKNKANKGANNPFSSASFGK